LSPECSFIFKFSNESLCAFVISPFVLHNLYLILFDLITMVTFVVQYKLLSSSPAFCYSSSEVRSIYSPQHSAFSHPQYLSFR
jgi:hypothetical protein